MDNTNEGIQEYCFNVCRFSYVVFINLISREWAIKIVEIVHITYYGTVMISEINSYITLYKIFL